jgi:hypothetical protein
MRRSALSGFLLPAALRLELFEQPAGFERTSPD